MSKTVIGLFDNRAEAQSVVQELVGEGFRRDDISVMSKKLEGQDDKQGEVVAYVEEDGEEQIKDMAKGAGTGAAIGGLAGLLVSLTALAIPGIGPVLAAGPLAAAIAGAGNGAPAGRGATRPPTLRGGDGCGPRAGAGGGAARRRHRGRGHRRGGGRGD